MSSILLILWNINGKGSKMSTVEKNKTQIRKSARKKCLSNKKFCMLTKNHKNRFSNKKVFFFQKRDDNLKEARSECV